MGRSDEMVCIPCIIKSESPKAVLIKVNDPTNLLEHDLHCCVFWLPRSQIEIHEDSVELPDWLYQKKLEEIGK